MIRVNSSVHALVALSMVGIVGGCVAAPPRDAGFGQVRHTISARTEHVVSWRGHSAEDAAVDAAVRALLQRPLTADGAAQVALLNNRRLQATFEELGIARADLVQAGLLRNPVLDLSIRVPDRRPSKTYLDFAVAADFIDAFLVPARTKLAGTAFEQAKLGVINEVLALAAETKSAFYEYEGAVQTVELRRLVADAAAASADAARRLREAGNTTELDYLGQRTQDARARIDLADAQARSAAAKERVNQLMGIAGPALNWTAAGRLADPPLCDAPPPEQLEALAMRQRQDLLAARQAVAIAGQALGLTKATRFLSSANLGPEAERETDGQWRIGPTAALPIPLFDQGQAAVARSQSVYQQGRQRYLAMIADVRSQVRASRTRMVNARDKAQLYRRQVLPLEQQFLAQAQLQYNGMYIGIFQLLQAKREEIDAGSEYIAALREYWTARTELEKAVGGRLPGGQAAEIAPTRPAESAPAPEAPLEHQHHHHGAQP